MNSINGIKIELIPVLISILETRSLTETSKKLGVTQSAVSHSLKKLRANLNDELVIRDGNRLALTSKAESMYPALKKWMGDLEGIIDRAEFDPMTSNKVFYIATTDIVEQMFMPQILKRLSKSAPNIGVRLIRWNPDLLPAQTTNSEIDLAIGVRSFDMPILMRKVLYKETFVSAARSSHPLFKSKMKLEDFLSYPHTMTSSGDRVKGVVDSALEKLNSTRILTHTVSNFSSTPFVLENSDCILTAPRRFLLSLEKRRKIKVFEPPVTLPSFEIKLMWSKKYQKDSASVWMRELLYKTFNQVISNIEP